MRRHHFWMPVCGAVLFGAASVTAAAGEPQTLTPRELDGVTAGAIDIFSQSEAAAAGRPGVAVSVNRAQSVTEDGGLIGVGVALGFASGDEARSTSASTDVSGQEPIFEFPFELGSDAGITSISVAAGVGVFRSGD